PSEPRKFWSRVHRAFPLPEVARILSRWFPNREAEAVPPPLPAWCSAQLPLGVLRADWSTRGDVLAFDQRAARPPTRVALHGAARVVQRPAAVGGPSRGLVHPGGPPRLRSSRPAHPDPQRAVRRGRALVRPVVGVPYGGGRSRRGGREPAARPVGLGLELHRR